MFLFPAALPPKNAVHSDVATSTHLLPPTSSTLLPGTTGTSGKFTFKLLSEPCIGLNYIFWICFCNSGLQITLLVQFLAVVKSRPRGQGG